MNETIIELFHRELASRLQNIAYQTEPGKYNWNDAVSLAEGASPTDGPPSVYGCLADGEFWHGNGPLEDAWAEAWGVCVSSGDVGTMAITMFREFLAPLLDFGYQWSYTGPYGWHHASDLLADADPFSPPSPAGVLDSSGYNSDGAGYCASVWGIALAELENWLIDQGLINVSVFEG